MCGRFHFGILPNELGQKLKQRTEKLNLVYSEGEIFPSNNVLCVIPKESKVELATMKWGIQAKSLLINARIESVEDRPTYNEIKNNRCAIICNGFYEWDKDKNIYYISFEDDYMYLACIFNKKDELVILTMASDKEFSKIHDRKPIIMNKKEMLNYIHGCNDVFTTKRMNIKQINQDIKLF